MIYEVVAGKHKTTLIGAYLPTSTLDQLSELEEALKYFLVRDSVVLVDLNADIGRLRNTQEQ